MTAQNPTVFEPADCDQLANRLTDHADAIENIAARRMADDMRLAAKLISTLLRNGVIHTTVALVGSQDRRGEIPHERAGHRRPF
jgi:hypothetical protein